jgi:multidrug efflux system membrane fusion protein
MKNTFSIPFLILFSLLMLTACKDKNVEVKTLRPVSYQSVGYLGGETVRTFSGTARTNKIINLSFRNNGIITVLNMKLGQVVKKGELLSQLDNVQARLNYESALEALNSAASQMNTAKLNLNRVRSLYEKGSSALSDYEAAKNSYTTAVASYESAKRSVSIQQEQIKYGYLYAPEDGIIATVYSEMDENVTAGETIGVLNAGADMEINIGLPESVINGVTQGMEVAVNFSSLENQQFKGKVTEVSPAIDESTSTYPIKVTLIDPSSEIKSGMSANVTFNFGTTNSEINRLIVPAKAVGEDSNGQFVFLIEGKDQVGTVKKQPVKIGALTTEGFEILEGLKFGDQIATAGLQTLLDGQEVKLK